MRAGDKAPSGTAKLADRSTMTITSANDGYTADTNYLKPKRSRLGNLRSETSVTKDDYHGVANLEATATLEEVNAGDGIECIISREGDSTVACAVRGRRCQPIVDHSTPIQ